MPNCENCGSHVSASFARVNSVNGTVEGCVECKPLSDLH